MRGEDLGDHRPHDRQCGQMRAASLAFDLQPRIRERGEDDVALPSRKCVALEVIESEFVLEFLICCSIAQR